MARSKATKAAILIPLFFLLNITLSLLNRYALGHLGFAFPLVLTAFHALFGFLFLLPAVYINPDMRHRYMNAIRKEWRGVAFVGFWLSVNIALNNLSLVHISLSLNQVIRASIPLVTAVVSAASDRRLPPRGEFLGLVILCMGVATAIGEASASGNSMGVALCMLSVFAGAAMLTATARVLRGKINSVQLMFFASPVTWACLLPPFLAMERLPFLEYVADKPGPAAAIVLTTSFLAGSYNVVHNDLVAMTDPVTTCVLGQLKIIVLMVLSAVLLGEGKDFSQRMSVGCAAAILGFSIYSWAKIKGLPRKGSGHASGGGSKQGTPKTPRRTPQRPPMLSLLEVGGKNYHGGAASTPDVTLPGLKTPGSRATAIRTGSSNRRRSSSSRPTPGRLV